MKTTRLLLLTATVLIITTGCKKDEPEPQPLPKSVTLGAQSNAITSGVAGSATFTIATANIDNGATGFVQWFSNAEGATVCSAPEGISTSVSIVTDNKTTVTISASSTAEAGTFWFKIVIDDATSNLASLTIDKKITYIIKTSELMSFGALRTPYTQPESQTIYITNTGTGEVTLTQPTALNYKIGALSAIRLTAGSSATFTVRPKASLSIGTYNEIIEINGTNDAKATVSASFEVQITFDGAGTAANPFKIGTAEQLKNLADLVNSGAKPYADESVYFQLTENIDLNVKPYNESIGWNPIGCGASSFKGIFDGNYKTISGLFINSNLSRGLFNYVSGGTVKNLTLTDVDISSYNQVGGVVGTVDKGGSIVNCSVSGSVKAVHTVGGIAGYIIQTGISACSVTANVSGYEYSGVGGIAGILDGSSIDNCYCTGSVNGCYSVGGISGRNTDSSITNCYATGAVRGKQNIGGIAGYINRSTITGCAALNPSITCAEGNSNTIAGRVVGDISEPFTHNFFSNNLAFSGMRAEGGITFDPGKDNNKEGADVSSADAKVRATYENAPRSWKFGANDDNPWKMGTGNYPLPVLYWQTTVPTANISHLK